VYHYAFAQLLASGNLYLFRRRDGQTVGQEGSQPPLYYWSLGRLISGLTSAISSRSARRTGTQNIGDPLYPGNKNSMLYSALQRPLAGTNLALHIGRWFSL
jgi:hypothetical protein